MPTAAPAVLQGPPQPTEADAVAGMTAAGTSHDVRQAAIDKESDAALDPMRKDILAANTDFQTAAAKPAERAPLPQNTAKHLDPKTLNDTASIFMTLGALAGLMTRQPLSAALGNMTAAMKGVQAGDAEQYDRAMSEFKVNFDHAMKTNDAAMKEREAILSDKKMSLTAKMDAFKLVSAKYGEQTLRNQRSFMDQMKVYEGMLKATKETHAAGMQMLRLQEKIDEFRAREARLGGGGGGATVSLAADPHPVRMVNAYKELLFGDKAFVGWKSADRQQQRKDAAVLGASLGLSPVEQAMLPTSNAMKVKAADALTKWGAFIDRSMANIELDLNMVVEAAKRVDPGSMVGINKAIQAGAKQFQNGAAQAYALAVNKLNTEYIRMQQGPLSNAMLHVDAAKKADDLLNVGISAENWAGDVGNIIRAEAANTKKATAMARDAFMADIASPGGAGGIFPAASGWTPEKEKRLQALHEWRAKALQELRAKHGTK